MQTPGTYISAIGHTGLIGLLILGWGFQSEPMVFDDISVSVISGEEFEQMTAATTPEPGEAAPTEPVQPVVDDTPPPAPTEEQPTEVAPPPEPVEQPDAEVPPPPAPAPPPETEVTDAPPVEPAPPIAPPPTPDVEVSDTPAPPQAERISPEASAPPPPDAQIDDAVTQEVVPDPTEEPEVVVDPQPPTAPPESAPEIAIADLAPTTSARPVARPSRPTPPAATPEEETETAEAEPPVEIVPESDGQTVEDILADLDLDEVGTTPAVAEAPAVAAGPPMTGLEESSFRLAVSACWVVDNGAASASVVVEVGFGLNRDGTVIGNQVNLLSATGGDEGAQRAAFDAAKRAVVRCSFEGGGYKLPPEKYERWKEVVITFDPSTMRLR